MKKALCNLSVVLIVGLCFKSAVAAEKILNYQGRLFDSAGRLLGEGGADFCFKFSIYDDAGIELPENKLWPAGGPSTMVINVKQGVFNAAIGDVESGGDLLDLNFQANDPVFLNIEIANMASSTCGVFETLNPRPRIFPPPFTVDADTVDGFNASQTATGNEIPVLTDGNLMLPGGIFIGGNKVLDETTLGLSILNSSLTSVGVLNNLTIAGNLDVATGTLVVSAFNQRIGIGTSTPSRLLSVQGSGFFSGNIELANLVATGSLDVRGATSTFLGAIGIGTAAPSRLLDVESQIIRIRQHPPDIVPSFLANGEIALGSVTSGFATLRGRLWIRANDTTYMFRSFSNTADVSEFFRNNDSETNFGHIVGMGNVLEQEVVKTAVSYESNIIGVVSDDGSRMNDSENNDRIDDLNYKNVGLLGRILTYVSNENGPVSIGDPITSGSLPGIGMKADKKGKIVGFALQPFDQNIPDKILVFVNPQYFESENKDASPDILSSSEAPIEIQSNSTTTSSATTSEINYE